MAAHRGYARRHSDAHLVPEVAKELEAERQVKRRVSIATVYNPKKIEQPLDDSKERYRWSTSVDKQQSTAFIVNNPSTWKSQPMTVSSKAQKGETNTKERAVGGPKQSTLPSVPEGTSNKGDPPRGEVPQWKKDLFIKASKVANNTS